MPSTASDLALVSICRPAGHPGLKNIGSSENLLLANGDRSKSLLEKFCAAHSSRKHKGCRAPWQFLWLVGDLRVRDRSRQGGRRTAWGRRRQPERETYEIGWLLRECHLLGVCGECSIGRKVWGRRVRCSYPLLYTQWVHIPGDEK